MNYDDIVSNLMQELRRGTLIIVVLSQLKKEEYGYNLITKLKENGITVEANTLYPLLRVNGILKKINQENIIL